jgi:hypothetical protein
MELAIKDRFCDVALKIEGITMRRKKGKRPPGLMLRQATPQLR